eukprot:TRINITY_DN517_c0_g1_i1.p1 TRINITY_DN517_c0_g1~~TRINITY_DN517_c0_g1_i1.p1  ORF type:complete len:367 (-),score=61.21 TRINITY_DN517_c0_g1_i1:353-1453(-)
MFDSAAFAPATNESNVNQTNGFPFMPLLTASQRESLVDVTSVFGWTSLVCTFYLIVTYGTFKLKRKYPANFTFYFCITAFATNAAFIVGSLVGYQRLLTPAYKNACIAQAVTLQFFGSATVTWWFLLTINLYFLMTRKKSHKKYVKYYHIGAWSFSALVTFLPIGFNKYGPAGLWCWIMDIDHSVWQFSLLYGWMGVMVLIGAVLWVLIILTMVKTRTNQSRAEYIARYTRYVFFVLSIMLVYGLVVSHRIIHAINPMENSFVLWMLHAWALSSIGLFVFLVFGTAKDMYTGWYTKIRSCTNRTRTYRSLNANYRKTPGGDIDEEDEDEQEAEGEVEEEDEDYEEEDNNNYNSNERSRFLGHHATA